MHSYFNETNQRVPGHSKVYGISITRNNFVQGAVNALGSRITIEDAIYLVGK